MGPSLSLQACGALVLPAGQSPGTRGAGPGLDKRLVVRDRVRDEWPEMMEEWDA